MKLLSSNSRFVLNEADISATVIEGEAIMMNVAKGIYCSTEGPGARIWELASQGWPVEDMVRVLCQEFEVQAEQARQDIHFLVEQFLAEDLLVEDSAATPPPSVFTCPPKKEPYAAPALEVFRELGHLLALDPPMPGLETLVWETSNFKE